MLRRTIKRWRELRFIHASGFFDVDHYVSQLPKHTRIRDAISHYYDIGESFGLLPNPNFNPPFYRRSNPDLVGLKGNLFVHYLRHGRAEGRAAGTGREVVLSRKPLEKVDGIGDVVLLVIHEMSRTGAPILAWNILCELKRSGRRVVVLSLRGGELRPQFELDADFLIEGFEGGDIKAFLERVVTTFRPAYAICNSISTAPVGQYFETIGVRTVGLVHEFGSTSVGIPGFSACLNNWSAVVFPAQIVKDSVVRSLPALALRELLVFPQGKSIVPTTRARADEGLPNLPAIRDGYDFVVLGAGSVDWRKGIDLFIGAAAAASRQAPEVRMRFIWVGGQPNDAPDYRILLREQALRSGVDATFVHFDGTEHIENAYRSADAFLMSSRLDPLPNVSIDAAVVGLPVVCFEGATGIAELMAADPACRDLVVPYADTHAAAERIVRLARDGRWRSETSIAMKALADRTFDMSTYVAMIDELGLNHRRQAQDKRQAAQ